MSGSIYDPTAQGGTLFDPRTMALLGMAGGFAQAAMHHGKVPFGAVLGMGAQGLGAGMQAGQASQLAQQQIQALGLQNQIQRQFVGAMPGMMNSLGGTLSGTPSPSAPAPAAAASRPTATSGTAPVTPVTQDALPPPDLKATIDASADKYGVPHQLAYGVFQQESGFGRSSPNIGQITQGTASDPGYGLDPLAPQDVNNAAKNIDFSLHYLSARAKSMGLDNLSEPKQAALALQAYNGGGDPNYAPHVMRYAGSLYGGANGSTSGGESTSTVATADDQSAPQQGAQVAVPTMQQRQTMQLATPDDTARAAVRQLLGLRDFYAKMSIFKPEMARVVGQIQAQLDNIAGPRGIVDPLTGNVYTVPGALQNQRAVSEAEAAGKTGPMAQQAANAAAIQAHKDWMTPKDRGGGVFASDAQMGLPDPAAGVYSAPGQAPGVTAPNAGGGSGASAQPPQAPVGTTIQHLPNGGVAVQDTSKAQDELYHTDRDEVAKETGELQGAQADQARLLHLRDILTKINTGALGDARAEINAYIKQFSPAWADKLSQYLGAPDATLAQQFQKLALTEAGSQEQGVLGSRGGFRAIQLFQKANPSLNMTVGANQALINNKLIAHQLDVDYIRGEQSWVAQHGQDWISRKANYTPLTEYDKQWSAQNNPQVGAAAMAAINGAKFDDWAKFLNAKDPNFKQNVLRVLQLIGRADPTATVFNSDGTRLPVSKFMPQQTGAQ